MKLVFGLVVGQGQKLGLKEIPLKDELKLALELVFGAAVVWGLGPLLSAALPWPILLVYLVLFLVVLLLVDLPRRWRVLSVTGKTGPNLAGVQFLILILAPTVLSIYFVTQVARGGATATLAAPLPILSNVFTLTSVSAARQTATQGLAQPNPFHVNPDAALYKEASRLGMGAARTDELAFTFQGRQYVAQGFVSGILYAEVGQWDMIMRIDW